jgi:hypothetical protein
VHFDLGYYLFTGSATYSGAVLLPKACFALKLESPYAPARMLGANRGSERAPSGRNLGDEAPLALQGT